MARLCEAQPRDAAVGTLSMLWFQVLSTLYGALGPSLPSSPVKEYS